MHLEKGRGVVYEAFCHEKSQLRATLILLKSLASLPLKIVCPVLKALMRRLKAVESELATRDANTELKQYKEKEKERDRLNDVKIAGAAC